MSNAFSQSAANRKFAKMDEKVRTFLADHEALEAFIRRKKPGHHVPYVNIPLTRTAFIQKVICIRNEIDKIIEDKRANHDENCPLHTTLSKLGTNIVDNKAMAEKIREIVSSEGPLTYITFGPHLTKELDVVMELRQPKEQDKVAKIRRGLKTKIDKAQPGDINHVTISRIYGGRGSSIRDLNDYLYAQRKEWKETSIIADFAAITYRGDPRFHTQWNL